MPHNLHITYYTWLLEDDICACEEGKFTSRILTLRECKTLGVCSNFLHGMSNLRRTFNHVASPLPPQA